MYLFISLEFPARKLGVVSPTPPPRSDWFLIFNTLVNRTRVIRSHVKVTVIMIMGDNGNDDDDDDSNYTSTDECICSSLFK